MIIEIKGLPEGQKIKHINVDIEFDDSGEIESVNVNPLTEGSYKTNAKEQSVTNLKPVIQAPPATSQDTNREQKEIPNEMKNIEF